jgi:peptidoglycan/LPS O-acetylase OafA/YrhL
MQGAGYMKQLDGLRFIAVSAVMFGHWTHTIPILQRFNTYSTTFGVNLFFVLSGFLIAQILITNKQQEVHSGSILRTFYIRRFLRIFPLYYAVVFACILFKIPFAREHYIPLITYTANYSLGLGVNMGYMVHLWSLSVEEQFYIFFPLLVVFIPNRHQMKAFILLTLSGVAFRLAMYCFHENKFQAFLLAYDFTPSCVDCFGIGAILAHLRVNNRQYCQFLLSKNSILYLSFACYLLLVIYEVYAPQNPISMTLIRFTCAVCCFFIIGKGSEERIKGFIGNFLQAKWIVYLGKISYGLYVYHYFIPWILAKAHVPLAQIFYLPVTILISALSWHFFEAPINNLKDKFPYYNTKKVVA